MPSDINDELLDRVARHVANRLNHMLEDLPNDPAGYAEKTVRSWNPPRVTQKKDADECSFCGGAGEVETEIVDSSGTHLILTIDCPH
jgi:hypothetical protein